MKVMRAVVGAVFAALLAVGCSSEQPRIDPNQVAVEPTAPATDQREGAATRSTPPARPRLRKVQLRLEKVAEVEEPTAMATRGGDEGIYVTGRQGYIFRVADGKAETLLDWHKRTVGGNEEGMLGLAFSPDGARLYVYYIEQGTRDSRLDEYTMDGNRLDRKSRREVLLVEQPDGSHVHKGGQLAFGDDGMLYLSLGDGGPSDVPPDTPQDMDTLLGKLIRIDPTASGNDAYTVPADNPFVQDTDARPEIFALGLRNPWRFSFDRDTGDLWLADVGRYQLEEINRRTPRNAPGSNFGWPFFEGTAELAAGGPDGTVEPLLEYEHEGRCAVVGGYVYRGATIEALRGAYLYSDHCDGQIRAIVVRKGEIVQEATLGAPLPGLTSFGQDSEGELYVLSLEDGLQKITAAD